MNNLEILKQISLGSSVAEDERKELAQYFITTNAWERLLNDDVDIVYGGKGTAYKCNCRSGINGEVLFY